jgi:hypothetical protein
MDISSPEKLIIANRRRRLVELRVSGQTLESAASVISVEFELPNYNRSRAHEDFIASLSKSNKLTTTEVNAYRKLEELRLDFMWSKLLPAMESCDVKAIDTGVKLCRAKSQLLGLDAAMQNIVENSVKQELTSVLDQLQKAFDAPTYQSILNVIAGKTEDLGESGDF